MKEQKITTYGDLKCRKAELRNQLEKEIMEIGGNFSKETCEEYRSVLRAIKWAETWLLWTIVLLMLIFAGCNVAREGCHLIGAAGQDVGWMANKLGDNIQTEK